MREIPIQVTDEYVRGAGVAVGAARSHDDVALRISFSPMWDRTARSIVWLGRRRGEPTTTQLGMGLLAEGETEVYLVPIPAEPKALPGEMTMTIKGATVSGGKDTDGGGTVPGAPESAWDPDAEESADITPTQAAAALRDRRREGGHRRSVASPPPRRSGRRRRRPGEGGEPALGTGRRPRRSGRR